jgi:uncharacterized membrane protein
MTDNGAAESRHKGNETLHRTLIGVGLAAAAGGAAFFLRTKLLNRGNEPPISDAPRSTFRGKAGKEAPIERSVTINKPRQELYAFWRDFTNLPGFMDNISAIERLDDKRSRWVVKAPAGTEVEFISRVTEDTPGELIAWETEEDADVRSRGRIEFLDAAPGRGTMVRAVISYDPPAGALGRALAKVLQREPAVQARRDLRRFKQLMETGEITSSASPSGRKSEDPTKQYL